MRGDAVEVRNGRERTFRRPREFRFRGLADEHVLRSEICEFNVRRFRSDRVGLLADDEQKCEIAHAAREKALASRDHRGDHAFRIACTAPIDFVVVFP